MSWKILTKRLDLNAQIVKLVSSLSLEKNENPTLSDWNSYFQTDNNLNLPRLSYILLVLKRQITQPQDEKSGINYISQLLLKNGFNYLLNLYVFKFKIENDFISIKSIISLIKIINKVIDNFYEK